MKKRESRRSVASPNVRKWHQITDRGTATIRQLSEALRSNRSRDW